MANLKFELFRLSLRKRDQLELFQNNHTSRADHIRSLFLQKVSFRHHGTEYEYVPSATDTDEKFVYGKIGRKVHSFENAPPEDGYEEIVHEGWKAAIVVVDPYESDDGQKVAIQEDRDVGKAQSLSVPLLAALEREVKEKPYLAAIHTISQKQAFWDFVAANEGKITRLSFELEVPNMFGTDDEYDQDIREYRDIEQASRVKIEISNPDGLNAQTERVRYTADRAMEQGTGVVRGQAMGKDNRFSSKNRPETTSIPVDKDELARMSLIKVAKQNVMKVFGRE